jgi:hypothetical protein
MEWLPLLYAQHKDWPGLRKWVFVEGADRTYAVANPGMVTSQGLSADGTSDYLARLAKEDERVVYIPHGWSIHADRAQGKCPARQRYLDIAETIAPELIIVLDSDEFYPCAMQPEIVNIAIQDRSKTGFCFRHRDIWYPPSMRGENLFTYEVVGGFWDIPYCRTWRWRPGLEYRTNHNTPEYQGVGLDRLLFRGDKTAGMPYWVHMGFACKKESRLAKNRFYEARGEGQTDFRGWYVESRAMWADWKPGDELPRGARVIPYDGVVPEAFLEGRRHEHG